MTAFEVPRTHRSPIRTGLVIHGPEVIDSGKLVEIAQALQVLGPLHVLTGGTMARVAALDSPLGASIDTAQKMHTSDALTYFSNKDAIVLANCGKTIITGTVFGQMVSSRVQRSVIQVERLGASDGRTLLWRGIDGDKFPLVHYVAQYLADNLALKLQEIQKKNVLVYHKDGFDLRYVHGAKRGECILVDGKVVGTVVDEQVIIAAQNGSIVDIKGVAIKEHGLAKIGYVDLEKAYVKTGYLRRNNKVECSSKATFPVRNLERGEVAFINHAADRTLESVKEKTVCAITIGDDTTAICSDILSRVGIPIVGITDGDADGIYRATCKAHGSVVILLKDESDDEIGYLLEKNNVIAARDYTLEEVVEAVITFLHRSHVNFMVHVEGQTNPSS